MSINIRNESLFATLRNCTEFSLADMESIRKHIAKKNVIALKNYKDRWIDGTISKYGIELSVGIWDFLCRDDKESHDLISLFNLIDFLKILTKQNKLNWVRLLNNNGGYMFQTETGHDESYMQICLGEDEDSFKVSCYGHANVFEKNIDKSEKKQHVDDKNKSYALFHIFIRELYDLAGDSSRINSNEFSRFVKSLGAISKEGNLYDPIFDANPY